MGFTRQLSPEVINIINCLCLVFAVLMEISEDWQTAEKRYVVFDNEDAING